MTAVLLDRHSAPDGSAVRALDSMFAELEEQRRRALRSYWRTALILAGSLPIALLPLALLPLVGVETLPETSRGLTQLRALLVAHSEVFGALLFAAPIVWIIGAVWVWRRFALWPRNAYLWEHKRRIFGGLCAAYFPDIAYEPGGGMPWRLVDDSGLFAFPCDVYSSEDLFAGRWGATDVSFSEAVAQRERKRGWGQNRETVYETYFRGIVFSADFHKHFHSTTCILPKGAEYARVRGEERAHLEDPAFERTFDTWTTDQVDARYVLSPSLLERLTALNGRFRGLRARFHDERLLLLLPSGRDRFEPSFYRRADDRAQLDAFVADVRACLAIVDDLNLNTRIWSKS
jgi:hypothetical protein